MLVKFRIRGALRYLSHAEMLKLFQRAFARAGIKVRHSQGFNPRPKLSLPLPRPVGVESDDELLCVWMLIRDASYVMRRAKEAPNAIENVCDTKKSRNTQYAIRNTIKDSLSEQLPEGCELLSVSLAKTKRAVQPCLATYIVPVQPVCVNDKLNATIEHLLTSDSLIIERQINNKNSKLKVVDVRPFLESIDLDSRDIVIVCKITSSGSIRVDEILKLLEIDTEKLTAPVRRTNVQWMFSES
jgi:hypothetical protein